MPYTFYVVSKRVLYAEVRPAKDAVQALGETAAQGGAKMGAKHLDAFVEALSEKLVLRKEFCEAAMRMSAGARVPDLAKASGLL